MKQDEKIYIKKKKNQHINNKNNKNTWANNFSKEKQN